MYQDKILVCKECGKKFTFTASEQEFYASKGFTNEPGRCPDCRAARKKSDARFNGPQRERQLYPAICANCGAETMVPFKPTGDRPVYCKDCFRAMRTR